MKHWLFCGFMALMIWLLPSSAHAELVTPEILRLHVVADSDSAADQALKLQVRDAVLREAQELLADVTDVNRASAIIEENLERLADIAAEIVSDEGFSDSVHVKMGEFSFPERIYGGVTVPAGQYRALRVTIGKGAGQNWWCVLYPTLCCIDETVMQDGQITFYSHTLQWLAALFGGDVA